MASQCPQCHQVLDEDYVCCAGIEFQWTCTKCHKRSRGFAIPFGRCPLCGGELLRMVEDEKFDPGRVLIVQAAIQIEISSCLFYHRLAEAVDDPQASDFFESLALMEREHAIELSEKYHVHLAEEAFRDTGHSLPQPFFEDLCFFADTGDIKRLFNCAINLERRTLEFFLKKSKEIPAGVERRLYLELAAEEEEHIALLESQRDHKPDSGEEAV